MINKLLLGDIRIYCRESFVNRQFVHFNIVRCDIILIATICYTLVMKRKDKTYTIFEAEKILGTDFLTLHRACKYGFINATKVDNTDRFGTWRISEKELKRAKKTLPNSFNDERCA